MAKKLPPKKSMSTGAVKYRLSPGFPSGFGGGPSVPPEFNDAPPGRDEGPSEDLGSEDSIFQILYDTIIGEQGIPQGVSPEVLSAIEGRFRANPNISVLEEIARQIAEAGGYNEWLEQQEDDDDSAEDPEPDAPVTLQDVINQTAEELGEVDETVSQATQDFIDQFIGAIPSDVDELKDLVVSVFRTMSVQSKDCESWTGRTGDGEGGTYQSWEDCVNLAAIIGIPGLNLPLPPGMVDITVRDFKDLLEDAGQSLEDFLEDPSGWLEETLEDATQKVKDILADMRGGVTSDRIADIISGVLGGWVSASVLSEIEEYLEDNPLVFIAGEDDEGECPNGAINYPECTNCPEGTFFF